MSTDTFWIVWCPTGARPPSHRHETYQDAVREAERLAECAYPSEFFVLRAVSRSRKVSVVTSLIGDDGSLLDDEAPF